MRTNTELLKRMREPSPSVRRVFGRRINNQAEVYSFSAALGSIPGFDRECKIINPPLHIFAESANDYYEFGDTRNCVKRSRFAASLKWCASGA